MTAIGIGIGLPFRSGGAAAAFAAVIATAAPRNWYRLGETSGTAAVDAGSGAMNGVYTGTYTQGAAGGVTGDADKSLQLAGAGLVKVSGLPSITAAGDYTLAAFVRVSQFDAFMVVGIVGDSGTSFGVGISIDSSGHVQASTNAASYDLGGTVLLNTWAHVAIVFGATGAEGFINGVSIGSNALGVSTVDATGHLRLGASSDVAALAFQGRIDEFQFYTRKLSAAELLAQAAFVAP